MSSAAASAGLGRITYSEHLLPRLFGFELMMAPYAICHIKLALEIGGRDSGQFTMPAWRAPQGFSDQLAWRRRTRPISAADVRQPRSRCEARSADAVKRDRPVMVVIGNPPYSGHSANKGKWIKDLLHGRIEGATGNYFGVDGQPLGERNPKWLNDDYVKFIRFAQWRIEQTGEGVLGFVTNHNYLDNAHLPGYAPVADQGLR